MDINPVRPPEPVDKRRVDGEREDYTNRSLFDFFQSLTREQNKLIYAPRGLYNMVTTRTRAGVVTAQSLADDTSAVGSRTLQQRALNIVGKKLRFRLCGHYTTDASAGNATIAVKLGTTTVLTTASFALDGSQTNDYWMLQGNLTVRSTGATGTILGQSGWEHQLNTGVNNEYHIEPLIATLAVTVDLTAELAFDVVWTATDAGTSITCTCFSLWEEF